MLKDRGHGHDLPEIVEVSHGQKRAGNHVRQQAHLNHLRVRNDPRELRKPPALAAQLPAGDVASDQEAETEQRQSNVALLSEHLKIDAVRPGEFHAPV